MYGNFAGYQAPNPYLGSFVKPSGVQFVNGIESARAYPLMPNSQQILMDKEQSRFYWVEADASGMKSIKAFDFSPVKETSQQQYLTVDAFNEWRSKYESALRSENTASGNAGKAPAVYENNKPRRRTHTAQADA